MKCHKSKEWLKGKFFLLSLFSFVWVALRSGFKPSRIVYPCQQAAFAQFSSYLLLFYPAARIKKVLGYFKGMSKPRAILSFSLMFLIAAFLVNAAFFSIGQVSRVKSVRTLAQHRTHPPVRKPAEKHSLVNIALADVPSHRVVSIHDSDATNWNHSTGYHWQYIDQTTVDQMIGQGVMILTGTGSIEDAWSELIPYQEGDQVAIKFNFNNSSSCGGGDDQGIDGYSETANAVIDGLVSIGVPPEDIWIYDAMHRVVPDRFIEGIDNQDVQFFGGTGAICDGNYHNTSLVDPGSVDVSGFSCDAGNLGEDVIRPSLVLVEAEHLINIPLFKSHGSYVTLALKNHYGSVYYDLNDNMSMHKYFESEDGGCDLETENVLADINNNPHIRDKTRLVIGEGIFGNPHTNWQSVERWEIFGDDDPNIYFFSADPIAISSVMTDYIMEERGWQDHWQLHAGALLGLGVHEHWDNFTNRQYSAIEYIDIDFDDPAGPRIRVVDPVSPENDLEVPFGGINEGDAAEKEITIISDGTAPLLLGTIAGGNPLDPPFEITGDPCSGQSLLPGGSCGVKITFSPTEVGSFEDTFDIPSNDEGQDLLTVSVSGEGLAAGTNRAPTIPALVYPDDGQLDLGTDVTLKWKKSTDPDGDSLSYYVNYCENDDFSGCEPVKVAFQKTPNLFEFASVGFLMFGIVSFGRDRKKLTRLLAVAVIVAAFAFGSCGTVLDQGASSDEMTFSPEGLAPETLYYWNVTADDGQGQKATSEARRFTT